MSERLQPLINDVRIEGALWPADRINDLIVALARRGHLDASAADLPLPPAITEATCGLWLEGAARTLGLEAECTNVSYAEMKDWLRRASLAIVPIRSSGTIRFAALLGGRRLLAPNMKGIRVSPVALAAVVFRSLEEATGTLDDSLLDQMQLSAGRRETARRAMLAERLAEHRVPCWSLGMPADAPARALVKAHHLINGLCGFLAAHTGFLVLWIGSWWLVGAGILSGRLEPAWLVGWALLLATLIPLRMAAVSLQGRLSIAVGTLLRARLLEGTLRVDTDAIAGEGAGQLLGRVLESDALESLALSGGFTSVMGVLELTAAAVLLTIGVAPWAALPLAVWCALAVWIAAGFFARTERWTNTRLQMTNALVERLVGHRTRVAQEAPAQWHLREDQELDRYLNESVRRDGAEAALHAILPQGWLIVGLIAIAPMFLSSGLGGAALAAGLGAVLLAHRAFRHVAFGISQLAAARAAWLRIRPLLSAATDRPRYSPAQLSAAAAGDRQPTTGPLPVLDVQGLTYRYPSRNEAVLRHCSLTIGRGDRLLLEGASGCGKSTLVALLAGLRSPHGGSLLAGGLDRATLGGDGWRRRIGVAPQVHQNHMITGTLSFNLLMGRSRSPSQADLDEARTVCREMGLEDLLARMPGGLNQLVGETGWQLSHGERARVFLARALLQRAALVVLDESFAALDPDTFDRTLACVLKRAPSLMVVAHR